MAQVTVTPETFTLVLFDAPTIARVVGEVADRLGVPADEQVSVEVDEESILGKTEVRGLDPITLWTQSGAIEDAKRPRQVSEAGVADSVGVLLVEALDRRDPAFGAPPLDEDLDIARFVAWQAHSSGRLAALGYPSQHDRRQYHFRNRHGFTDVADHAFARLWSPEPLTFAEIQQLSDEARAAQPA
ncbi:hypothetical protein B7486_57005 [cyanobacterium TDX16]|nr:hypothetical protein B7486_57005 [cyanobacterium TDX16]